jgi:hypothetical protein
MQDMDGGAVDRQNQTERVPSYVRARGATAHFRTRPFPSRCWTVSSQERHSVTLNRRTLPTNTDGQSRSLAAASHHEGEVFVRRAISEASMRRGVVNPGDLGIVEAEEVARPASSAAS